MFYLLTYLLTNYAITSIPPPESNNYHWGSWIRTVCNCSSMLVRRIVDRVGRAWAAIQYHPRQRANVDSSEWS